MGDEARDKALALCRSWWAQANDLREYHQISYSAYVGCISDLAQAFGIAFAEVGRKEPGDE